MIEINKGIQFGRPCIKGTGVPTENVYERYQAGDTVAELAYDYGVTAKQIQAAIDYEKVSKGERNEPE